MAGDWIKMRCDLFTHPKVVRMASALQADTLRIVGGLMSAWCLFDAHAEDGALDGYTLDALDAHVRWPGFAVAMVGVDWLLDRDGGIALPRFDAHNGQSAKRRATEADRKRAERNASASDADKKRTREEKRREEKKEKESGARGARLPNGWEPCRDGQLFATSRGLSLSEELARFRDYWTAQPGQKGTKTDWDATWRNWCRNAKKPASAGPVVLSFAERDALAKAQRVHELSGGLAAAKPAGTRQTTEVFDVTPRALGR